MLDDLRIVGLAALRPFEQIDRLVGTPGQEISPAERVADARILRLAAPCGFDPRERLLDILASLECRIAGEIQYRRVAGPQRHRPLPQRGRRVPLADLQPQVPPRYHTIGRASCRDRGGTYV